MNRERNLFKVYFLFFYEIFFHSNYKLKKFWRTKIDFDTSVIEVRLFCKEDSFRPCLFANGILKC